MARSNMPPDFPSRSQGPRMRFAGGFSLGLPLSGFAHGRAGGLLRLLHGAETVAGRDVSTRK